MSKLIYNQGLTHIHRQKKEHLSGVINKLLALGKLADNQTPVLFYQYAY